MRPVSWSKASTSAPGFLKRLWLAVSNLFFRIFGASRPTKQIFEELNAQHQFEILEKVVVDKISSTTDSSEKNQLIESFSKEWVDNRASHCPKHLQEALIRYLSTPPKSDNPKTNDFSIRLLNAKRLTELERPQDQDDDEAVDEDKTKEWRTDPDFITAWVECRFPDCSEEEKRDYKKLYEKNWSPNRKI